MIALYYCLDIYFIQQLNNIL